MNTETRAPSLKDIPGFPFRSFKDLTRAVADEEVTVGIDPLAAARWADSNTGRASRAAITGLSVLLFAAAAAALVAATAARDYLLLLGLPAMAAAFYLADPGFKYRKYVSIGAAVLVAVFLELLVNGFFTLSIVAAYAAVTFGSVRAAAALTGRAYRRALLSDEAAFVRAFVEGGCSVRLRKNDWVYIHGRRDL